MTGERKWGSLLTHIFARSFFAARWKNVGVAATLLGFVGGAFLYTINSVSKNDFDEFDSDGIRRVDFEESKVQKQ